MKWARLIVPTGVCVLAATAVATGAVGGSKDQINGCVTSFGKNKGELRVLTGSAKCSKGETAITWNQSGPQGLSGAKGDAGSAGAAGPQGSAGPQGPKGDAGPAGRDGTSGVTVGGSALTDGKADVFMKVRGFNQGDFKGDATAPGHEGWIALRSVQLTAAVPTAANGTAAGSRTYGPFVITKLADRSSVQFLRALATNENLTDITIAERRPGDATDNLTYVIKKAFISKLQQGGVSEPAQLEQYSIMFASYKVDDNAGGSFSDDTKSPGA